MDQLKIKNFQAQLKAVLSGKCCDGCKVSTVTENLQPTLSEEKFRETKNQILGAGQIFLFTLLSFAVLGLNNYCRDILSENIASVNAGCNRTLLYLNKMALPTFMFILVPALILIRNDKIKRFVLKEMLGLPCVNNYFSVVIEKV